LLALDFTPSDQKINLLFAFFFQKKFDDNLLAIIFAVRKSKKR